MSLHFLHNYLILFMTVAILIFFLKSLNPLMLHTTFISFFNTMCRMNFNIYFIKHSFHTGKVYVVYVSVKWHSLMT